ncbi:MAG: hypothetical protein HON90_15950 [Halobacteriovoraceae bacterium]|jgi:hypothetical protein|nr:hypothetical protein [Halobacteriovoraceae bacterium]
MRYIFVLTLFFTGVSFSQSSFEKTLDEETRAKLDVVKKYGSKLEYANLLQELKDKPKTEEEPTAAVSDKTSSEGLTEQNTALDNLTNVKLTAGNTSPASDNFMTKMINETLKKELAKAIKKNPFSSMSSDEVKSLLLSSTKGSKVGAFLDKSPKLTLVISEVVRDKKAFPSFLSLINKPAKIKKYGIFVVVIFLVGFFLNMKNSKGSMLKRIFIKLGIMLGITFTNLLVAYFIFREEVKPTIDVVMRNLFS